MKISFDEKADAMYIQFQESNNAIKETIKIKDGFLVDIGTDGKVFGIEILDASKKIPKENIGKLDIDFPVRVAV
ncbi:MAG: hypothetical protein AUJ85_02070 [Elusimicrobia bacterium CG1_02_37_114]|nr:MAG: hypothetical protein AUJ85_02070 [Elusimicrobia bacterium CG1_02_37_114]PIV53065.1 MAG: DUF2283 domain-containing protein [Elusimicrobia bacterium CG02_land_8_20_14_3_00_37_13]PIZ13069.1 MAG: DUF2283 domain-containing protein [Elusimicrobia bacterium CG_4_10_14_0_8_um_filter_37_32]